MLLQFSVKNFMSIKNEVVFSMLAGTGDENMENVISLPNNKEKYLKTTAFYGANATGKTNFMRALTSAILMIRKSNIRNINERLIEMNPFKFDDELNKMPCEFEFIFIKNNIKYIYGFSADINKIYTEYLYYYSSAKPSLIFERNNINEYKFPQAEQSKLNELASKNTDKKLFLSTATAWNYEKTKDAFMWFAEDIDTYDDYKNLVPISFEKFEKDINGDLKKFTINLLKLSDIIINDYTFEVNQKEINNYLLNITNINNEKIMGKEVKISTKHEIEDEKGDIKTYELDLSEESLGTYNLFMLSPILKDAFEKGKTIVIDEIDKSLHPLLVKYIIGLFHNSKVNKNNAQLIFNTHDINLLSLDLLRRDQIWFVEKDFKKGATEIYPLDDFSVRKTENIQKGYLNGRYGGIPFVAEGNSPWEE